MPDNGPYGAEPWRKMAGSDPAAYWHARWEMERVEVERLEKLIEPPEWKGWEQIDSIYEEARLLRRERDSLAALVDEKVATIRSLIAARTAALGSKTPPDPAQ